MEIPERTLEQVTQEHNQTAYELGVKKYQIKCFENEASKLIDKLLKLNEEGSKLMKEKENAKVTTPNGSSNTTQQTIEPAEQIPETSA